MEQHIVVAFVRGEVGVALMQQQVKSGAGQQIAMAANYSLLHLGYCCCDGSKLTASQPR